MKKNDIKKLKKTGKLLSHEHMFYMPLVYFNSAVNSANDFSDSLEEFNNVRNWFLEKKRALDEFYITNNYKSLDDVGLDFLSEWPDGLGLDLNSAFEQTHSCIAKTMANFFNFLTNTVAAVESSVNLRIAELLNSGEISKEDILAWDSKGIAERHEHLLNWMGERRMVPPVLDDAFVTFKQVVTLRNHLVHYKFSPAIFSTDEIEIAKIVGEEKVSEAFSAKAVASLKVILVALYDKESCFGEMVFERNFRDYSPPMTPSPYIVSPR
ncbi:hypothetical protein ACRTDN_23540 [Vibrio alginolyticus]|uniref:hypothetical protein n=1 Tax=Vibrio alginolyticus TaxID=663 RepID=UPI0034E1773C